MAEITTEISIGAWADRATLDYVPCNQYFSRIGFFDATGIAFPPGAYPVSPSRRPYKADIQDGIIYLMFDSGISVPIFRITTAGE